MQFIHNFRNLTKKPMAVYVLTFLTLLVVISFFSLGNLIMAYKNGEEINNQTTGEDHLESDFTANVLGKNLFLNLNGGMRRILGQREMNGVVLLDNGFLAEVNEPVDQAILTKNARHMATLQQELEQRDIPLLYVLTPYKIQASDPELPHEIEDSTNDVMDAYIEQLQNEGVQPLDLRESFLQNGTNPYELFYRTDHHWNIQGGFFAYTVIARQAEKLLKVQVDPALLSKEQFVEEVYPRWHLGSYGQRTGALFAGGADDFSLLLPDFATTIVNTSTGDQGTFEEIVLDQSYLQKKDATSRYTYDRVLRLGNFQSLTTGCGKKVLLVCDSMGRAVLPYLTLAFGDVCYVDAYNPQNLTKELLDSYQPDLVIVMHYPTVVFTTDAFAFPDV